MSAEQDAEDDRASLYSIEQNLLSLLSQQSNAEADSISRGVELGRLLRLAKGSPLIKHRDFGRWCEEKFHLKKSQRCAYMNLDLERLHLEEARIWGTAKAMRCRTAEEMVRVLRKWKGRNAPQSNKASKNQQKPLSEDFKAVLLTAYGVWVDENTSAVQADEIAADLLVVANEYGVTLQSLLHEISRKVPDSRRFPVEQARSCLSRFFDNDASDEKGPFDIDAAMAIISDPAIDPLSKKYIEAFLEVGIYESIFDDKLKLLPYPFSYEKSEARIDQACEKRDRDRLLNQKGLSAESIAEIDETFLRRFAESQKVDESA